MVATGLIVESGLVRPSQDDWALCRNTAKSFGRSFYLASRLLPPQRRQAILAAYAYCRTADDIVDRAISEPAAMVEASLDDWERQLATPTHPIAIAFAAAREDFGIPEQPVRELLQGLRQDLSVDRYETWDELQRYCYLVAGTVGLIVAPILGCRDSRALAHAATLGIAMQLTNILRDVEEDAAMGRVYLPEEELHRFGVTAEAILSGNPGAGFSSLMRFQIERARTLYSQSYAGIGSLSHSGRLTTLAAAELYSGILDEIERLEYDVFRKRAIATRTTKARCMSKALGQFARMTVIAPPSGFGNEPLTEIESSLTPTGHAVRGTLMPPSDLRSYG